MATEAQIKANRSNAKRSTGPKTPLGKSRSATNALRHGVYTEGATAIPRGPFAEDPRVLEEAVDELAASLRPRDAIEWQQARGVAGTYNQLRRLNEFEAHALGSDTSGHPHLAALEEAVTRNELAAALSWNLADALEDDPLGEGDAETWNWEMFANFTVEVVRPEGGARWVADLWLEDRVPADDGEWRRATRCLLVEYCGDIAGAMRWVRQYSHERTADGAAAQIELMETASRRAIEITLPKTIAMRSRLGRQLEGQLAIFRKLAERCLNDEERSTEDGVDEDDGEAR